MRSKLFFFFRTLTVKFFQIKAKFFNSWPLSFWSFRRSWRYSSRLNSSASAAPSSNLLAWVDKRLIRDNSLFKSTYSSLAATNLEVSKKGGDFFFYVCVRLLLFTIDIDSIGSRLTERISIGFIIMETVLIYSLSGSIARVSIIFSTFFSNGSLEMMCWSHTLNDSRCWEWDGVNWIKNAKKNEIYTREKRECFLWFNMLVTFIQNVLERIRRSVSAVIFPVAMFYIYICWSWTKKYKVFFEMSIDSIHGTTMADPMKCEDLDSLIESLRLLSFSLI